MFMGGGDHLPCDTSALLPVHTIKKYISYVVLHKQNPQRITSTFHNEVRTYEILFTRHCSQLSAYVSGIQQKVKNDRDQSSEQVKLFSYL